MIKDHHLFLYISNCLSSVGVNAETALGEKASHETLKYIAGCYEHWLNGDRKLALVEPSHKFVDLRKSEWKLDNDNGYIQTLQ